jgi:hypothetical protein
MSYDQDNSGTAAGHGFIQQPDNQVPKDIESFAQKVITSGFRDEEPVTDITLRFFLWIENHPDIRRDYDGLKERWGQWQLNAKIGRWIKEHYRLVNGPIVNAPKSSLIKAYTTHSRA